MTWAIALLKLDEGNCPLKTAKLKNVNFITHKFNGVAKCVLVQPTRPKAISVFFFPIPVIHTCNIPDEFVLIVSDTLIYTSVFIAALKTKSNFSLVFFLFQ